MADRLAPPFVNQARARRLGMARPGTGAGRGQSRGGPDAGVCLRRRGWLGECDGSPPAFHRSSASTTDASGMAPRPPGASFLERRMDPVRGPVCEVVLVKGSSDGVDRVVIRTHHAALDGRGAGLFAADLFAVLRGEEPEGAKAGPFTDVDLARMAEVPARKDPPPDRASPTGRRVPPPSRRPGPVAGCRDVSGGCSPAPSSASGKPPATTRRTRCAWAFRSTCVDTTGGCARRRT